MDEEDTKRLRKVEYGNYFMETIMSCCASGKTPEEAAKQLIELLKTTELKIENRLGSIADLDKNSVDNFIISFTEPSQNYTLFLPKNYKVNVIVGSLVQPFQLTEEDAMGKARNIYPDGNFLLLGTHKITISKYTIIILREIEIIENVKKALKLKSKNSDIDKIIFTAETEDPHITLNSKLFHPKRTFEFGGKIYQDYPATFKLQDS